MKQGPNMLSDKIGAKVVGRVGKPLWVLKRLEIGCEKNVMAQVVKSKCLNI